MFEDGAGALYVTGQVPGQDTVQAIFRTADGGSLEAGRTYQVDAKADGVTHAEGFPTIAASDATARVLRNGETCGATEADMERWGAPNPVVGRLHVTELERDGSGTITRFAASYVLSCQSLTAPTAGLEGSISVNSVAAPAAVPDAPVTPGPLTGFTSTNVGPIGWGSNTTKLAWTKAPGTADVAVDMVQATDSSTMSPYVTWAIQRVAVATGGSHSETAVDWFDTRSYRVVPRGADGRLGAPRYVTVAGTRMSIPETPQRVVMGRSGRFGGRVTEALPGANTAHAMDGAPVVGKVMQVCRITSTHTIFDPCDEVDTVRTDSDGRFTMEVRPTSNTLYSIKMPATARVLGNLSAIQTTLVAPQTDLAAQRVSVSRRRALRFSTSAARAGTRGVVLLQRHSGGRWLTVARKRLSTSGARTTRLSFTVRDRAVGTHDYRAVKPADARHTNGVSRVVHVRVH
jgi:hypothetical protein